MTDRSQSRELQDVVDLVVDGRASAKEICRLEELIQDPGNCRFFVEHVLLDVELKHNVDFFDRDPDALSNSQQLTDSVEEGTPSVTRAPRKSEATPVRSWMKHASRYPMQSSIVLAAIAVGLLLAVMAAMVPPFYRAMVHSGRDDSDSLGNAAELVGLHDVNWGDASNPFLNDRILTKGQRLNLRSGLAEIKFGNGATVVLEGPCDCVVTGPGNGTLHYGKLVADVPEKAIGFQIRTPHCTITDLGTRFGVVVSEQHETEMYVFDGQVEAAAVKKPGETGDSVRLTTGESARFRVIPGGVGSRLVDGGKPLNPADFTQSLPRSVVVEFQDDQEHGYTGTQATFVRSSARASSPDTSVDRPDDRDENFGNRSRLILTNYPDPPSGVPEVSRVLLRFDDLIGAGEGQIPPDATIESAVLILHVTDEQHSASTGTIHVHELKVPWDEETVTWASLGDGKAGLQGDQDLITSFLPTQRNATCAVDVTGSLRRWLDGEPNRGWLLTPIGDDRAVLSSDDALQKKHRPRLIVRYHGPVPATNTTTPE